MVTGAELVDMYLDMCANCRPRGFGKRKEEGGEGRGGLQACR